MNELTTPLFICIVASFVWAPIVYLVARRIVQKNSPNAENLIWNGALTLLVLPVALAPIAAAAGVTLRQAPPPPEPFVYVPHETVVAPMPMETASTASFTLDPATVFNAFAALYFYGFALFAVLFVVRYGAFAVQMRKSTPVDHPQFLNAMEEWRSKFSLRRPVEFRFSPHVTSFCVHGFIRQKVIAPEGIFDKIAVEDAVLMGAHELAHIKRNDTTLFALCGFVSALFWFNPFVRALVSRVCLSAEQEADALVIGGGVAPKVYAECFVEGLRVAAQIAPKPVMIASASFTPSSRQARKQRLKAILNGKPSARRLSWRSRLGLLTIGVGATSLAVIQAAVAVAPNEQSAVLTASAHEFNAPVDGRITAAFGITHKYIPDGKTHSGIDIAAKTGTTIIAPADGLVLEAGMGQGDKKNWGNLIVIDHGDGLVTRYAHLDSVAVKARQSIKAGEEIGKVGSTGRSTGPHLHFEVIVDGEAVDPSDYVKSYRKAEKVKKAKVQKSPAHTPSQARKFAHSKDGEFPEPVAPLAPVAEPQAVGSPEPEPEPAPEPSIPEPPSEPKGEPRITRYEYKWVDEKTGNVVSRMVEKLEERLDGQSWTALSPEALVEIEGLNIQELETIKDVIGDVDLEVDLEIDGLTELAIVAPRMMLHLDGEDLSDEDRAKIEEMQARAHERLERAVEQARANAEEMSHAIMIKREKLAEMHAESHEDILELRERVLKEAKKEMENAQKEIKRELKEVKEERRRLREERRRSED